MGYEEGEISEPGGPLPSISDDYDPAYEWPGEPSNTPSLFADSESPYPSQPRINLRPNQPTFRLIVLRSSILASKHRVAVIDGHSEIQFGRDVLPVGSTTPKIRLKEMEVSKVHATAYWDGCRREWGVVDMGSVHGTFLHSASISEDDRGVRLSPPRQASIPKKMNHMDRLTIGGTTFLVHMHDSRQPCEGCWVSHQQDELPLFPSSKASKSIVAAPLERLGALNDAPSFGFYAPTPPKDPKRALTMLKQSLLTQHSNSSLRSKSTPPTDYTSVPYIDRSARRRALMPVAHTDAPGVSSPSLTTWSESLPRPKSPVIEPISQPPTPLPPTNIGHRLLMKQGWEPGTALGLPFDSNDGRVGLVEPIDPNISLNREGLGVKRSSTTSLPTLSGSEWKETAKRRRWDRS